jgi:hypothetical protein
VVERPPLFVYLERALGVIAAEAPLHFAAMQRQLGARTVSIQVGADEPLRLCLADGPPWVTRDTGGRVEIRLGHDDLDAFLRGELTLEQGVIGERLAVRGKLEHVLPFLDALELWLHGALRTPSAARLHREYLDARRPSSSQQIADRGMP